MSASAGTPYLLIDGVMMPQAYDLMLRADGIEDLLPLLVNTPLAEIKAAGPLLVKLSPDSPIHQQIAAFTHDWPTRASLLYTPAPIHELARHLRRFLAPLDVHGGKGLLRFADPLITHHWLGSYQGQPLNDLLGPIDAWHVVESAHAWLPSASYQWRTFERTTAASAWADAHAVLGQAQLDALSAAGQWRFLERLYGYLAQHCPRHLAHLDSSTLEDWFEARLEEADAWGLSARRCQVIWVEYSTRWGVGFTLHADGPYQQWLARTPDASKLASELRIQRMDRDCKSKELIEEIL